MVVHDIVCDGCGDTFIGPVSSINKEGPDRDRLHVIRKHYKLYGWRVNLPGGKDYCPLCWDRIKNGEEI